MLRQEASVKFIFQHSKKDKTGSLGLTVQELLTCKFESGNLFGTPLKRMNASEFQIFEIQVFIFNYSRISISQISENLGFLRFKGGCGDR